MIARAYAKINLALEVLRRRDDGYHEIASVLQCLTLHDGLSFTLAGDLTLRVDDETLDDAGNLVLRAARLLREESAVPRGAAITLRKHIPVAAGLGGGSSDAATTLSALARLWRVQLSRRGLLDLAARLGSDVPFFFYRPTALAEGRGERLRALPPPRPYRAVLIVPRLTIPQKTRRLYAALTPADFSDGAKTRALASALQAGQAIDPALLVNAFERVVLRDFPAVRACREALLVAGAPWARLSGSGPTLYTLFEQEHAARAVCAALAGFARPGDADVLLTETLVS